MRSAPRISQIGGIQTSPQSAERATRWRSPLAPEVVGYSARGRFVLPTDSWYGTLRIRHFWFKGHDRHTGNGGSTNPCLSG